MSDIEEIQSTANGLIRTMGEHWLENRLEPNTTFKINIGEVTDDLTTALNYLVWIGWVVQVPILKTILKSEDGFSSGWQLTRSGQELALKYLESKQTLATLTPRT